MAYFEQEWNVPNRHDWYLMQIASFVCKVMNSKGHLIKTDMFKLEFENERNRKPPAQEQEDIDEKQVTKVIQEVWRNRVNFYDFPENKKS